MSQQNSAINLHDVHLQFDGKTLFEGLNISIEEGRCTCILGPSGCGKSTLLKLISGNPDFVFSGEIEFAGESDSGVSWMSQEDLLLPWLTVMQNVMLGSKLRGQRDEELKGKVQNLLAEAGLDGYENSLPSKLSGGMRQRVALLRTLVEDRKVILMDEPFSALDALTRLKLQNLACRLIKGKTVLLVTHDPMEALRMGDSILVFAGSPVHVHRFVEASGETPRDPSSPETAEAYTKLMHLLMGDESI